MNLAVFTILVLAILGIGLFVVVGYTNMPKAPCEVGYPDVDGTCWKYISHAYQNSICVNMGNESIVRFCEMYDNKVIIVNGD